MGRLALNKPSINRKATRGKKKLAARSLPGVWLGVYPRTGEHIIAVETGEAIRVRTVHRLAEADRWSMDAVMSIKSLPRRPNPNTGETDAAPQRPQDRSGQKNDREDGADLGDPDCSNALGGPREMRITSRLLDKYGYTDGCLGCAHKQAGLYDHRQHSTTTTAVPESDFSSLSITGKGPPPALL